MKRLLVTLVSGFCGAGKTSLVSHVVSQAGPDRVAVITNDLQGQRPADSDGADVGTDAAETTGAKKEQDVLKISGGCVCCTLREDLYSAVLRLAQQSQCDRLLIECSGVSQPMQATETFLFVGEDGQRLNDVAELDTLVTVVDAEAFLTDFQSQQSLIERGVGVDDEDDRELSILLADQIECANVIILNKVDLVTDDERELIASILRAMNPEARVLQSEFGRVSPDQVLATGFFSAEDTSGGLSAVQAAGAETMDAPAAPGPTSDPSDTCGISRFTYAARRPFHPGRFFDFWMDEQATSGILRSHGYFWLASRPRLAGLWSHAGTVISAEPGGLWWAETAREQWPDDDPQLISELDSFWDEQTGDRRQELVLVGQDLDQQALTDGLNQCLLTDTEMAEGPDAWAQMDDPFVPWLIDEDEDDDEEDF